MEFLTLTENAIFVFPALALLAYMTLLYVVALIKGDNSIADIGYGVGFLVVAYASLFVVGKNSNLLHTIVIGLVTIWGGRLSLRIYMKNKGKPEDFRYAKWRSEWRWFRLRSYAQIFLLQGIIIYIIALPLIFVASSASTLNLLGVAGIALWLIGFLFEAIGDYQLDRFLKNSLSHGKLMTSGLWSYTRHPNYFGESTMWWGIFLITLSTATAPWWIAIVSPLLITFLLLKVSGIPMLEARMSQHADWGAYAKRTRAFLPWFPKSS